MKHLQGVGAPCLLKQPCTSTQHTVLFALGVHQTLLCLLVQIDIMGAQLLYAAKCGDLQTARYLSVNQHAVVDSIDTHATDVVGVTIALRCAADCGHAPAVKYLAEDRGVAAGTFNFDSMTQVSLTLIWLRKLELTWAVLDSRCRRLVCLPKATCLVLNDHEGDACVASRAWRRYSLEAFMGTIKMW